MEVEEGSLRSFNLLIKNVEKNVEHFITHDENQSSEILSGLREMYYLTKKEEAACGRSIKGCPFERLQLDDTNFDVEVIWQQIQLQNEFLLQKLSVEAETLAKPGTVFLRKEGLSKDKSNAIEQQKKKQIAALEQSLIATKSWQLSGETSASVRPQNSVLEEVLQFDHTTAPAPVITEERSQNLVDIITQRIIENKQIAALEQSIIATKSWQLSGETSASVRPQNSVLEEVLQFDHTTAPAPVITEERSQNLVDIITQRIIENKQIAALEQSNIATKSWQLSGETSASVRPQNSLLGEVLQFDHTTAPAPVITEERSQNLVDIITQRIKDNAWDDVERKEKPVKKAYEYKKAQPISQEKSKMSLSEIYEREYQQQQNPEEEKENKEHVEIKKLMKSLFSKLDALANFHFTPMSCS